MRGGPFRNIYTVYVIVRQQAMIMQQQTMQVALQQPAYAPICHDETAVYDGTGNGNGSRSTTTKGPAKALWMLNVNVRHDCGGYAGGSGGASVLGLNKLQKKQWTSRNVSRLACDGLRHCVFHVPHASPGRHYCVLSSSQRDCVTVAQGFMPHSNKNHTDRSTMQIARQTASRGLTYRHDNRTLYCPHARMSARISSPSATRRAQFAHPEDEKARRAPVSGQRELPSWLMLRCLWYAPPPHPPHKFGP